MNLKSNIIRCLALSYIQLSMYVQPQNNNTNELSQLSPCVCIQIKELFYFRRLSLAVCRHIHHRKQPAVVVGAGVQHLVARGHREHKVAVVATLAAECHAGQDAVQVTLWGHC